MTIRIAVVFEDGREETIREYDDYAQAVGDAIGMADSYGFDNGDGHGPPKQVRIYRAGRLDIGLAVIRGGLAASPIKKDERE